MGADVATWAAVPGYVDYLAPQLYYSFENQALPYQQALEEWEALPRHPGLKLYAGLALYKAGTDADGGTWLSRDDIIALQAEAALQSGCQGVLLYSWEAFNSQQPPRNWKTPWPCWGNMTDSDLKWYNTKIERNRNPK